MGPRLGACLVMVSACVLGSAVADIETRVVDGQLVYVSRPDEKPSAGGPAATAPRTGRARTVPSEILDLVRDLGERYDLDPRLITSVISVESGFNRMAVSPKGARGLMQLMPATAREYGVRDVHNPKENLEGGVAYLRDLVARYNGDLRLALAAYNAGPDAVERASGVPNYPETIDYLRRIEKRYGQSLAVASMGPDGGIASRRRGGNIHATVDENGSLVVTNRRGNGVRVIRPSTSGQRR